MNGIKVVIGSWGSYNECNERALGSKWLDLSDYEEWDEIVEELKKEGFELDGIDEALSPNGLKSIITSFIRHHLPVFSSTIQLFVKKCNRLYPPKTDNTVKFLPICMYYPYFGDTFRLFISLRSFEGVILSENLLLSREKFVV